jgi:hypothetical protein
MQNAVLERTGNLLRQQRRGTLKVMESPLHLSCDELAALERGEALRLLANESQPIVVVLAEQDERLKQCVDFADTDPTSLYPLIADVLPDD